MTPAGGVQSCRRRAELRARGTAAMPPTRWIEAFLRNRQEDDHQYDYDEPADEHHEDDLLREASLLCLAAFRRPSSSGAAGPGVRLLATAARRAHQTILAPDRSNSAGTGGALWQRSWS